MSEPSGPEKAAWIPETPLRIFERDPTAPQGPFYVRMPALANDPETRDITDEELKALAQIIYNAYLEWKQQ